MTDLQNDDHQRQLVSRGVNPRLAAEILAALEAGVIERTLTWFDAQEGRVGAGVLVAELRQGGRPAEPRRLSSEGQQVYGEQIVAWLRQRFPQWNREEGAGTHPAAIAAVTRLHHEHGKGNLTVLGHGPAIRAAVERFETELGPTA